MHTFILCKFQACIDGNIEVVEFLVVQGSSIDQEDNEGWTPLHATASCGFMDIAKYVGILQLQKCRPIYQYTGVVLLLDALIRLRSHIGNMPLQMNCM